MDCSSRRLLKEEVGGRRTDKEGESLLFGTGFLNGRLHGIGEI